MISPSLIHAMFSLPDLLWNTEMFPMHFLGKRRQKLFDGNLHYSPSFSYFSSHNRKFLKRRRFPNEFLRYCDSKYFHGKTWDPLISSIPTFRCQKILETPKCSQKKFAVRWDDKNRRQNVISLFASIKRFLCLKFLETTKSSQWIFR